MAVVVNWKQKIILNCSNSNIIDLSEMIKDVVKINKIKLNETLTKFIERFDIAGYGWSFDLADYIKTKEDLITFIYLIRNGINRYYTEIPDLPQITKDRLENFYKELVKISESFTN